MSYVQYLTVGRAIDAYVVIVAIGRIYKIAIGLGTNPGVHLNFNSITNAIK